MHAHKKEKGKRAKKSSPPYTQIRNDFLRDPNLTPEEKLIGCLCASYHDANWRAWPGLPRLMRESGYGRDKTKRARSGLVEKQYLYLEREKTSCGRFVGAKFEVSEKILVRNSTES